MCVCVCVCVCVWVCKHQCTSVGGSDPKSRERGGQLLGEMGRRGGRRVRFGPVSIASLQEKGSNDSRIISGGLGFATTRVMFPLMGEKESMMRVAGGIDPEIVSLVAAHRSFARWERLRHRARTVALIAYPDGHVLRQAVDELCQSLDDCRHAAESGLARILKSHGPFRGIVVNGFCFESPAQMFALSPERYWDCPEFIFGAGCRRKKTLDFEEMEALRTLADGGSRYVGAIREMLETIEGDTSYIDKTRKAFENDCQRLQRRLKRVKVCPRALHTVLRCLRQLGPDETSVVVSFLL